MMTRAALAAGLALMVCVGSLGGCGNREDKEDVMMREGLDALYARHDPYAGAAKFREVLALDPAHYGATVQLAYALEAAGQPDDARAMWEKVAVMAESLNDRQMLDTAHAKMGGRDPMAAGLDALYQRNDPGAAIVEFQKVLQRDPDHYGANYQIAKALDLAGRPDEARPYWEKALKTAEAVKDEAAIATVQQRLAQPDAVSAEAWMGRGLDALYTRRDAQAAVTDFRKVLEANPDHYGGNYQLAAALDAAGEKEEARRQWTKVLTMAEAAKDQPSIDTARARLATP
ncbi:MAG TPA: tetratricopeptide repeat protein [Candidatus Dormibacteraeota bacterium]|nr:tetratricopeptide repeat protein [Candidatus Dormibacteraeota bacterium]